MTKIDTITAHQILNEDLPLDDLLENSSYYPASFFDGEIVRIFSKDIQSFIYCDYNVGEKKLIEELATFKGYELVAHRSVKKEELIKVQFGAKGGSIYEDLIEFKPFNLLCN